MKIEEIKKEMTKYRDFYGGDLLGDIDKAKTKKELNAIIERHRDFMRDMLSDADGHLDQLKQRLGLNVL